MIITISNVEERTSATNRKFWTVKSTNGGSWNVFDSKFKTLAGQTVEVTVTQNGKFENIELVRTGVTPPAPTPAYTGSVATYNTFSRDIEKLKGTSMSYAKDLTIACIEKGLDEPAQIIKTIDFFYRFIKDTLMENDEEKTEEALLEG